MRDAPAFDFYPERWLAGVAELSDADQLVLLRLLCHSWLRDGLPDDVQALSRLAGRKVSPSILVKFPLCEGGHRRNPRLETIRQEQRARIASRRIGASKTNKKRWGNCTADEPLSDRSATVERIVNESLSDRSATVERVANESPPPTTHPNTLQQQQRAGSNSICDLDEAKAYAMSYSKGNAAGLSIPVHVVSQWHDSREAVGWVRVKGGIELPIADWKADLRIFATHYEKNERTRPSSQVTPKRLAREAPAATTSQDLRRL